MLGFEIFKPDLFLAEVGYYVCFCHVPVRTVSSDLDFYPGYFQPFFQITLCKIPENHPQNQFSKRVLNSHSSSQYQTDYFDTQKKRAVTIKVTALFHHNIYILLSSQRSGRSRAHIRVRPSHSPVTHTRVVRICRERVILRFWYFALCAKNQLSERQRVLIFGAWF